MFCWFAKFLSQYEKTVVLLILVPVVLSARMSASWAEKPVFGLIGQEQHFA